MTNKNPYELCFPTIPSDLSKESFIKMLNKLNFGRIQNTTITTHKKKGINSGFVKYYDWNNVDYDNEMKRKLIQKKSIYIIYNFPNYLKCSLFK